jgi:hypothetical protein
VKDEMGNTVRYYQWEVGNWQDRAKSSESVGRLGHACYAWQQAWRWTALLEEAQTTFGNKAV